MEEAKPQLNRMGTEPIGRLMLKMGIPMILSMVLQSVYNIVDSAFVSNMPVNGELALNALTLAFPVQMFMVAIGIGTGVGTNALLSKSLGQQDYQRANRIAGNSLFLGFVIYFVFLLFGIFGVGAYIRSQSSNPLIIEMGTDYLRICCVISIGIVFFAIFEKLLQATGRSLYSTIAQISGAVANIILDPIMIYGWLGLPAMGVKGAAYATVIGQLISMALGLIFHLKVNREIKNGVRYMRPSGLIIKLIYSIGLPAIIAQALMSVMTYGLNLILGSINEAYVTAYGLYYKIQQFVLFAAFGLRDAITPIVSFNHGMRDKKRINDGVRYGLIYTLVIMLLGLIVLEILAHPLTKMFGLSGQTEGLCISAIRVISLSFVFAGANLAFQGIFQAVDSGVESLVLSVCRQLVFVLPVAYLFKNAILAGGSSWLVWLTFPIAEAVTVVIGAFMLINVYKKKLSGI
ncbi:MAG: MATE family efflux transporter [Oscillospiraceae bacterium]|nr:MATE family efflux transporter [Oscillospiraceae bacterium]